MKSALISGIRKVRAILAHAQITHLGRSSPLFERALREALDNNLSPAERDWVERIETARRELIRSAQTITVDDYGAGSAQLTLSDEEMAQGRAYETRVGTLCRACSKPYFWSLLLFKLIRQFQPTRCVELGTCVGISASYQGAALALNGQQGTLTTIEGSQQTASVAARGLGDLGLEEVSVVVGRFQDALPGVLEAQQPIDYVFVDGHHDQQATVAYFEMVYPYLSETALVVFDDISWSAGMRSAWEHIAGDPRIALAVDLSAVGVCLLDGDRSPGERLRIPLS